MKIMFIQPPMPAYGVCTVATYPSLGQALIASYLNEDDDVILLDGLAHPELLKEENLKLEVEKFNPDIVGLRIMFINYCLAMDVAREIKELLPKALICVGGPHASLLKEEILEENKYVDLLMYGEGENSFPEVVEAWKKQVGFEKIKGIIFRYNNRIIKNEEADLIELGNCIPKYDILDMEFYKRINFMTIEGKRGCSQKCIFCGLPGIQGKCVRKKPVEKVLEEIRVVHNKYGITKMEFVEPNFTICKDWVMDLCELLILEDLDMQFVCRTYVEIVDKDLLSIMKKAGFIQIFYGIESGSQKILDEYKRHSRVEDSINAIKWTKEVGIKTSVNFMIGAPSENEETVDETINLAKVIQADEADVSVFAPFPNTEFYFHKGIHLIDPKWYKKLEYVSKFPWFVVYHTDYLTRQDIQNLWMKAVMQIVKVK